MTARTAGTCAARYANVVKYAETDNSSLRPVDDHGNAVTNATLFVGQYEARVTRRPTPTPPPCSATRSRWSPAATTSWCARPAMA